MLGMQAMAYYETGDMLASDPMCLTTLKIMCNNQMEASI